MTYRQRPFTKWVMEHPVKWALGSGAIVAVWGALLGFYWWVWSVAGVLSCLLYYFSWRKDGPLARRERRRMAEGGAASHAAHSEPDELDRGSRRAVVPSRIERTI